MLPINGALSSEIEVIKRPSLTYKIDFDKGRMMRFTDGRDAVEQFIYKALMTDRYKYVIYDWNYGIQLNDLFGKPKGYAKQELVRRIRDCLMTDDRITAVDNFSFPEPENNVYNDKRNTVCISFTAHTIFGDIGVVKDFNLEAG